MTSSNNKVKPLSSFPGGGLILVSGPTGSGNSNKIAAGIHAINVGSIYDTHTPPMSKVLYESQVSINRALQGAYVTYDKERRHVRETLVEIFEALSPCVRKHISEKGFSFREEMVMIDHVNDSGESIAENECPECTYLLKFMKSLRALVHTGQPIFPSDGISTYKRAFMELFEEAETIMDFAEIIVAMDDFYKADNAMMKPSRDFANDAKSVIEVMRTDSAQESHFPADIIVRLCLKTRDDENP